MPGCQAASSGQLATALQAPRCAGCMSAAAAAGCMHACAGKGSSVRCSCAVVLLAGGDWPAAAAVRLALLLAVYPGCSS
jgi:hypothetical protein